ncbi:MAG TPA: hypothetical protein VHZ30_05880 [Verrucomicrobiae bacterium]|jgi:hypothetical protein|nr:hypothetical protein [Verrucomicrobiae bacterium]
MTLKIELIGTLLCASLVFAGCGTPSQHIVGSFNGPTYTSPRGGFSVPIPVSPEVGGRVLTDGPETVTFHDNWGSRITFSSFTFNAQSSMTSVMESQGRERALTEFAKRQYGNEIEPHYHKDAREGVISFIFLRAVGEARGVALFVHGTRVYEVDTDMLPGVQLLAQSDAKSQAERLTWLEGRAVALAQSMDVK